jgi:hypothetical protein
MVKHPELLDPDRDFAIRICMLVSEVSDPVSNSIEKPCAECEQPVWYHADQPIPVVPGVTFEAEFSFCLACASVYTALDPSPSSTTERNNNA